MQEFDKVKDSGKRQEFKTGSVRDTAEGKGTPHLIAGEALNEAYNYISKELPGFIVMDWTSVETNLLRFSMIASTRHQQMNDIYIALQKTQYLISKGEDGTYFSAMTRLAKHYENGSKKYSKNNWRKGQPVSRYYDSSMRHLWKAIDGLKDEDHEAALFWNLIGIIQTKIDVKKGLLPKELDDFPFTIEETFPKLDDERPWIEKGICTLGMECHKHLNITCDLGKACDSCKYNKEKK